MTVKAKPDYRVGYAVATHDEGEQPSFTWWCRTVETPPESTWNEGGEKSSRDAAVAAARESEERMRARGL